MLLSTVKNLYHKIKDLQTWENSLDAAIWRKILNEDFYDWKKFIKKLLEYFKYAQKKTSKKLIPEHIKI